MGETAAQRATEMRAKADDAGTWALGEAVVGVLDLVQSAGGNALSPHAVLDRIEQALDGWG